MGEVTRASKTVEFGIYLKTKATEGNLRAAEEVKQADQVTVIYAPDQTSGRRGCTETHAYVLGGC